MASKKTTRKSKIRRLSAEALNDWANAFHLNSARHGFWDKTPDMASCIAAIPEKLCLIHSEVSEALEDFRIVGDVTAPDFFGMPVYNEHGKPIGFASELADIIIRTMELASALGIDIGRAVKDKHTYNKSRPFKHGGKRI